MCRVRSAAMPIKISGQEMVSQPALWCSPTHTSSNPRVSSHCMSSRSRSRARVGFSLMRWKGAMKIPNFSLSGRAMYVRTPYSELWYVSSSDARSIGVGGMRVKLHKHSDQVALTQIMAERYRVASGGGQAEIQSLGAHGQGFCHHNLLPWDEMLAGLSSACLPRRVLY